MTPAELLASVDRWVCRLVLLYSRRVPPRQRAEFVEEFLADARAEVFLKAHTFDAARGSPTTWAEWRVRKALSNRLRIRERDRVRREKLRARHRIHVGRTDPAQDAADGADAFTTIIEPATPVERDALTLRFVDGLTLREIGERLGGVTRERANQIVKSGAARIRAARTALSTTHGGR